MKKILLAAFAALILSISLKTQTTSVKVIEVNQEAKNKATIKAMDSRGEIYFLKYGWDKGRESPKVGSWLSLTPLKNKKGKYRQVTIKEY